MEYVFSTIGLIIFIALVFDYINGFHDAANSIATVVSTRVLSPVQAVAMAAFFNFAAAFFFGTAVAKTVGSGLVIESAANYPVIMAALIGAITWNLITWFFGLPTSSSHALFGGLGGAAVVKAGFGALVYAGWVKTIIFIVVAPMIGLTVGLLLIKRTAREAREIMERCKGEVRRLHAIEFIGFDNDFVENVADALTGKNDIVAVISETSLQLVVGGVTYSTTIHRFREPA